MVTGHLVYSLQLTFTKKAKIVIKQHSFYTLLPIPHRQPIWHNARVIDQWTGAMIANRLTFQYLHANNAN